ncbi:hypothetical protein RvY_18771-2 [Ramazzottius varieornatus]|uniref:DDE-1 domain-containing protein n=1 Tax=Ramazzottius varieornatus TaxID=947166 RepID=A0A1D1WB31_RAMVA|nr:hypothetical protein RvY_18771-2 [Ramazzottius varieornatus]
MGSHCERNGKLGRFHCFPRLIGKLKRYYGIVDRKITKFVTKKSIQKAPHVKESAEACVALVRSRIAEYGLDCLWNADQSGFEYEMRPGRTSETAGVKHVEAITQSENSMTHSYTVMMAVSPGRRKFLPVLFLTLKEEKGVLVQSCRERCSRLIICMSLLRHPGR